MTMIATYSPDDNKLRLYASTRLDADTVNIRQSEIASSVAERELFVIEAEEMEDGCVQIVDVNFVGDGLETKFVGRTMNHAAFDPAASEPHGKAIGVVIAPI